MGSSGPYRGRMDRLLPEQWDDLSPEQVWYCMDMLINGAPRRQILDYLLHLPSFMAELITEAEIYDLLRVIAWMQLDPASTSPVAPYIDVPGHGRLYLPQPKMEFTTCREYMLIDDVWGEYIGSQDPEVEMRLIALMARPAGISPYMVSDPRVLLQSEQQCASWMPAIRALPGSTRIYIVTLISAMRSYVYTTYKDWLFSSLSGEGQTGTDGQGVTPEEEEEPTDGISLGWLGAFMDVAADGLFGTYDQVLDAEFHAVCLHMIRKVEQARLLRMEHDHARIRHQHA